MKNNWTLQDIDWGAFQNTKVDPGLLAVIKTASLVEYNAPDYGQYLSNIFAQDPQFMQEVPGWVADEVKHGRVLAEWVKLADPTFNLETSLQRFHSVFRISLGATVSIRGSHVGELVARCVVETGTSAFYTALADIAQEPVLKQICHAIAADEFRHYKLFYTHLIRWLSQKPMSRFSRIWIAIGRLRESQSDELASAYYAANTPVDTRYNRALYSYLYLGKLYGCYRPHHVHRVIRMICKAVGLCPQSRWIQSLGKAYWRIFSRKYRRVSPSGDPGWMEAV